MNDDATITLERVRIGTAAGVLGGELAYGDDPPRLACLLLNPHPHLGGSMDNNVVCRLAGALPAHGAATLRFDYRGVGQSTGQTVDVTESMLAFWESGDAPIDPGLIDDARTAAGWLACQCDVPRVMIGYSFGAFAALRAMPANAAGYVAIAPTLRQHDFSGARELAVPKLVIYSDNDFATPRELTESWIDGLPEPRVSRCIAGGEHFFRGREDAVLRACVRFLDTIRSPEAACR
jgi:hypothetical protein